jgi:tetratricopeptide (TPR) repeat protein
MKQLREFDRVRTIYEKYIEWDPSNSSAWIKFAELESQLGDFPRTRGIFELGISQASISMPELLWKAYIDFETEEGEREKARSLYERLIKLSGHVKVWISYALFEGEGIPVPRAEREDEEEDEDEEKEVKMVEGDPELARQVFNRGYEDLRDKGLKGEVFPTASSSRFVLKLMFTLSLARRDSRSLEILRRKVRNPGRRRQGTRNVPYRVPQACVRRRDGHARRGLGDGVQGRREGIKPDELQILADGPRLESEGKEGTAHSRRRQR